MSLNSEPGMERNYILTLVLCMIIILGWPFVLRFISPPPDAVFTDTVETSGEPAEEISAAVEDETAPAAAKGALAPAEGPFLERPEVPALIQYTNEQYELTFSTLGATITRLVYHGETGKHKPVQAVLFDGDNSLPGSFGLRIARDSDSSRTIFKLHRSKDNVFEFMYEVPGEYRIRKTFFLSPDEPVIGLGLKIENLTGYEKHFPVEMNYTFAGEDGKKTQHVQSEAVVSAEKIKTSPISKIEKKGFALSEQIEWVGAIKKYFALLIKPDWKGIAYEAKGKDNRLEATLRMEPVTIPAKGAVEHDFFIYAGPQQYETLKGFGVGFEDVLSRGIFGLFKIWLLIALKFTNNYVHNFGWSIIIITLILKGLFAPLTHMSYHSMEKMKVVQPKLKALQDKHKDDPQKLNKEMMELYKKHKVNPMGGCLPMLLQIPVFIAFYQVLNEAIELRGAPFIGWITDLSEPDALFRFGFSLPVIGDSFNLLPILMIGSMVWQQKLTPQAAGPPEQQKIMQFMPLIFGFIFYPMPSGLVLYWFLNNVLSIVQQVFVRRLAGAIHLHHDEDE